MIGVSPPYYCCASWLILSLSLSITLLSLSLPVLFHLFLCLILLSLSACTSLFLSGSFSRLMNLKLGGIVWPGETSSLFGPYFLLHNVFKYSCPSLFPMSLLTLLLPFKLATVTANHALMSRISRCCRLLFSKAAAVNLSFPEWEGRRNWPGGRLQLTSSHLLAQAAFARRLILYNVGLWSSGRAHQLYKQFGVSALPTMQKMYVMWIKPVTQHRSLVWACWWNMTPDVISCGDEFSNTHCLVEEGNSTDNSTTKKCNVCRISVF